MSRQTTSPPKKTTIYDIAQAAGASPSTVSLALTDSWKRQRISQKTVEKIRKIAADMGYSVNRQARALRQAKSSIAGMILPEHENRFFSELSQAFAVEARQRSLCPAIVFSGRNAETQLESLESLISFSVDFLVIVAAEDPVALSTLCQKHSIPHVFVDHPCDGATSVVTNNELGAMDLTNRIFERVLQNEENCGLGEIYFIGGDQSSSATRDRIRGFEQSVRLNSVNLPAEAIQTIGYAPLDAQAAIANLHTRLRRLPMALFINSITCFEGIVRFLATLPEEEIRKCTIGCYDYDPFATVLRFPVSMVHQRADQLVAKAFMHFDSNDYTPQTSLVPADLIG